MATARRLPEGKQTAEVERAFVKYVNLIARVQGLRYAFALPSPEADFYAVLDRRRVGSCRTIFEAEKALAEAFPSLLVDFHVVYSGGSAIDELVSPRPPLFYESRNAIPATTYR